MQLSPFSVISEQKHIPTPGSGGSEAVGTVNMFHNTMYPILDTYTRQWFLNIANYMGNQWVMYDKASRGFRMPQAPSWRVRLTVNKILPIARTQMAKLSEMDPAFYVAASTTEQSDVLGARVGTRLVEALYQSEEFMTNIFDDIVNWTVLTGNHYVFPYYDSEAGRKMKDRRLVPVINPETGMPAVGPDGQPVMQEEEFSFSTGEAKFDSVDPFELIPDFSTTKWNEMSGVIKRKLRSVEYIQEKYGVKVSPENFDMNYSQAIKLMSNSGNMALRGDITKTLKHAAIVKDYYQQACDKYPEGRHLIVSGDKELYVGPLPKEIRLHGKPVIPGAHFTGIKIPKRLLAMSPIENLLPLQWQYNRGRSQIIEDCNLMSRPKLLAPMDSIADDVYTDQPGEVIYYDPNSGQVPFYLDPPNVSSQQIENLNRLDQEMQDIGGVHEISMGRLPRRATSGFALNILEEKDTTIIAPIKKSIRGGLEKLFSMALSIMGNKYTEKHMQKIIGQGGEQAIMNFKGTDLASQYDVRVLKDQPFPQSRIAKMEFGQTLVKEGIISAQTARKMLGLDGFTNMEQAQTDEETARIQAEQMAARGNAGGEQEPGMDEAAVGDIVAEELQKAKDAVPQVVRREQRGKNNS